MTNTRPWICILFLPTVQCRGGGRRKHIRPRRAKSSQSHYLGLKVSKMILYFPSTCLASGPIQHTSPWPSKWSWQVLQAWPIYMLAYVCLDKLCFMVMPESRWDPRNGSPHTRGGWPTEVGAQKRTPRTRGAYRIEVAHGTSETGPLAPNHDQLLLMSCMPHRGGTPETGPLAPQKHAPLRWHPRNGSPHIRGASCSERAALRWDPRDGSPRTRGACPTEVGPQKRIPTHHNSMPHRGGTPEMGPRALATDQLLLMSRMHAPLRWNPRKGSPRTTEHVH